MSRLAARVDAEAVPIGWQPALSHLLQSPSTSFDRYRGYLAEEFSGRRDGRADRQEERRPGDRSATRRRHPRYRFHWEADSGWVAVWRLSITQFVAVRRGLTPCLAGLVGAEDWPADLGGQVVWVVGVEDADGEGLADG